MSRACLAPPVTLGDLVDQGEDAGLDELDQAFEHLRLAGEVAVKRRFADAQFGRQRGGGDALGARLFEHLRQRLQDLHAPLAGLRTLARLLRFGGGRNVVVGVRLFCQCIHGKRLLSSLSEKILAHTYAGLRCR